LITGGGSGIGRDTSLLLASEGAHVLISDIDAQSRERTTKMVKKSGDAHFVQADVRRADQVKLMIDTAVDI